MRVKLHSRSRNTSSVAQRLARIREDEAIAENNFDEDRSSMVAEAARAEASRRGAGDGFHFDDWLAAEDDVDRRAWCHRAPRRKSIN